MSKFTTVAVNIGSILLAVAFIGLGLVELVNRDTLGAFATWGYPERFRVLLGIGEICGGILLLMPRAAWYSAALLGILLAGALSTHCWTGPAELLWPTGALLIGVAFTGYARHPHTLTLARLRAVADVVAEREIAQQRRRSASSGRRKQRAKATSARTRPAGRAAVATNSAARNTGA